jgi:hypothetical protein
MTGEMACQHCHRPLNTTGEADHPRYIHPPHLGDLGHRPQPVPAASLDTLKRWCDFCGDHYPIWTLHGGQVNTHVVGPTGGLVNWGETWAATTCEALIAAMTSPGWSTGPAPRSACATPPAGTGSPNYTPRSLTTAGPAAP